MSIVRSSLKDGKFTYSMVLKNLPSSRKLITFDTKRKYVQLFQMLNDELILAKLQPDQEEGV